MWSLRLLSMLLSASLTVSAAKLPLLSTMDQLSAPAALNEIPDKLTSPKIDLLEIGDFVPSGVDMASVGEAILKMMGDQDEDYEEVLVESESHLVPSVLLAPAPVEHLTAEGTEPHIWVSVPLGEPGFDSMASKNEDIPLPKEEIPLPKEEEVEEVEEIVIKIEEPALTSQKFSEPVVIRNEKPPGWDTVPIEVKSKVEEIVPSNVSPWVVVPSLNKEQNSPSSSYYRIPPSEPETKPHLRVLNFSYKTKVSEADNKSVYKSQLRLDNPSLFVPEQRALDSSARLPRKSSSDVDLFDVIHSAKVEDNKVKKGKKSSLFKNKATKPSKAKKAKAISGTPKPKDIKSLRNKPRVSSLPQQQPLPPATRTTSRHHPNTRTAPVRANTAPDHVLVRAPPARPNQRPNIPPPTAARSRPQPRQPLAAPAPTQQRRPAPTQQRRPAPTQQRRPVPTQQRRPVPTQQRRPVAPVEQSRPVPPVEQRRPVVAAPPSLPVQARQAPPPPTQARQPKSAAATIQSRAPTAPKPTKSNPATRRPAPHPQSRPDLKTIQAIKQRQTSPSKRKHGKKYSRVVKKNIPIIKMIGNASQDKDRKFQFEYETGNGSTRIEQGYLKNPDSEHPIQVMQGEYSYTGDDGKIYTIQYIADERGFRAKGKHIPRPNSG